MKNKVSLLTLSLIALAASSDAQAGKAGAAMCGFLGGTIVGSALAQPRCQETVIVREPAPAPVVVTSSGSSSLRQENRELKEDNRYLEKELNSADREIENLKQENEQLQRENTQLKKENNLLRQELAVLKQPITK